MLTGAWDRYLEYFPDVKKDIYFEEGYVRGQARADDEPICFVYQEGAKYCLCPFLKRRVPWQSDHVYDVQTPYGYGGPITNTDDLDFATRAAGFMADDLRQAGVMAGFLRFHPLIGNQQLMAGQSFMEVLALRETVLVDLSLSQKALWDEQIHGKHRNAIRQAERAGLKFEIDTQWKYLEEFYSLYTSTMNRVNADDSYFFERPYFESMSRLSPRSFLGIVLKDGRCIAGTILMQHGVYGHYHLSASAGDAQMWRPNNFMVYEAALALKQRGVHWFHLGGAQDDDRGRSLFQFKSRFSHVRRGFFIGKAVLDRCRYDAVCAQWEAQYPDKKARFEHFFLRYRF